MQESSLIHIPNEYGNGNYLMVHPAGRIASSIPHPCTCADHWSQQYMAHSSLKRFNPCS